MRVGNIGCTKRLVVGLGLLAVAGSASAQITDLGSSSAATLRLDGIDQALATPVPSPNYRTGGPGGAGYSTSADIESDSIFFQAGSMAAGRGNGASSSIEVSFKVTGQSATEITRIRSTVFESNFGLYVANFNDFVDADTGELVVGCRGNNLPNCVPTVFSPGFSSFVAPGDTSPPITLASTQFTFDVLQDGASVRSISGSLDVVRSGSDILFTPGLGFADLATALNSFELFEVADKVYAFSWGRTNFVADLLNPIGNGETSEITYRITSSSNNFALPVGGGPTPSGNLIVAFACLADPIGRGGTRGSLFTIPGFGPNTCDDYDGDGDTPYGLGVPRIVGDTIDFAAPAIPEPDTWAMLIIGFGLVGLSMRRSSKPAVPSVDC